MKHILVSFALACILFTGCKKRFNCDFSDNEKLGNIEFNEMKNYNIESEVQTLSFSNENTTLVLPRKTITNKYPKWWIDRIVCEKIDIKPTYAYAYYEYENLNQQFSNDSILISIEPEILNLKHEEIEGIYINIANFNQGFKGLAIIEEKPDETEIHAKEMTYNETLEINGVTMTNTWSLVEDDLGIFYQKENGITAILVDNQLYLRD